MCRAGWLRTSPVAINLFMGSGSGQGDNETWPSRLSVSFSSRPVIAEAPLPQTTTPADGSGNKQTGEGGDKRTSETIYDSLTAKTFSVVKGQIPESLLPDLQRDFTESEIDTIYTRAGQKTAPSQQQPTALWIFGPSAVGKSFITGHKAASLFGNLHNAVVVDGTEFREVHKQLALTFTPHPSHPSPSYHLNPTPHPHPHPHPHPKQLNLLVGESGGSGGAAEQARRLQTPMRAAVASGSIRGSG